MKAWPDLTRCLPWTLLAVLGCGKSDPEMEIPPGIFADPRIAIVDFGPDSSAYRADFPPEAFPTHMKPFHGKDWEVSGFSIRLFPPSGDFIQFDCSIPRNLCVAAGREIGLEAKAFFQFPPGKSLLSFVAESRGMAGNLGSSRPFRIEREAHRALQGKFHGRKVVIAEGKVGHTPQSVILGAYFDRRRFTLDSLEMLLKAEGARFGREPPPIRPSDVHLITLIHEAEHEFGRKEDAPAFPFSATIEDPVDDRSELIGIFLGTEARWEEGGYTSAGCDCKYSWFKIEFHLKSRDVITVEVDPCSEGYLEAVREIFDIAYTLRLTPAQSERLRDYFAPLKRKQRLLGRAIKAGPHPCSD